MKIQSIIAAAALVGASSMATAFSELHLDINTLTSTFSGVGGFSTSATGTITLTQNVNSKLKDVLFDGVSQTPLLSSLSTFSGQITLSLGMVTGGFMNEANADGSKWHADILGGSGSVNTQSTLPGHPQQYQIDGLTFNNLFTVLPGFLFDGINIAPWVLPQPDLGNFLNFAFAPDAGGQDTSTDVDAYVLVPLPEAAGLGLIGLAGVAARRRR